MFSLLSEMQFRKICYNSLLLEIYGVSGKKLFLDIPCNNSQYD